MLDASRCVSAMPGCRCRAVRRADAGNDLNRDTGCARRFHLLPTPPEHERITALQPHDVASGQSLANQQRADFRLRQSVLRSALGHTNQLRAGTCKRQNGPIHQPVMHYQLRLLEQSCRAQGQQVGLPGASADKI